MVKKIVINSALQKGFVALILMFILVGCSVPASSIELNANSNFLNVNGTLEIQATVLPSNASDHRINWSSSNENVATVINGIVSGKQPGSTVITASAPNGVSRSLSVEVRLVQVEPSVLSFDGSRVDMLINDSFILVANFTPANTTERTVTYTSSNPNVATINSDGLISALGVGSTVITGRTNNGLTANISVHVSSATVEATSVSLNQTQLGLETGKTFQLVATLLPSSASRDQITYSSNNQSVATINPNGLITGIGEGVATITARTSNGRTATVRVLVRLAVGDRVVREVEPNGRISVADFLPRNGTTFLGNNSSKNDVDVFRINVPSNVTITIIFSPEFDIDSDYYLIGLFTAADVLISAAVKSGNSLILRHEVALSGNYYIKVFYDDDSPYSSGDDYTGYVFWE